jgi:D-3-phosphoglycerate dehydrogenase
MKIKVIMRSVTFQQILDSRLRQHGFSSKLIDMDEPLAPQLTDSQVIVNGFAKIDKSLIDQCPNLQLVHQAGIGYDNIDVAYCRSKSILVANVPLANSISVAEHALFLMMLLAKNLMQKEVNRSPTDPSAGGSAIMKRRNPTAMGVELYGKTLLVIGLGASGAEVAKRAKSLGMNVVATTKDPVAPGREKLFFADEVKGPKDLHDLIPKADFISLHVPLNDETRGLISDKEFELMKNSAFLVNVARAAIVDRDLLFVALKEKNIAGAAFDVFWEEPPSPDDKLLHLDNFVLTPHIAGWTKESVEAIAGVIASNIVRVADGKIPLTLVGP